MVAFAGAEGFDMTIIEVMPMGDIGNENRVGQYLPVSVVRARLEQRFTLTDTAYFTPGPARYVEVGETGRKLGFITPMTHNFCESCNRVRIPVPASYICVWVRMITPIWLVRCGVVARPCWRQLFLKRLVASQKDMILLLAADMPKMLAV